MHAHDPVDLGVETSQISSAAARLDPLLSSFLLRSVRKEEETGGDTAAIGDASHASFTFTDATKAMVGLQIWEASLRKARLPLVDDFSANRNVWPDEPLFSSVREALSELGLARLVRRHPEILTSVLLGVAKVVIAFIKRQRKGKLVVVDDDTAEDEEYNWEDDGDGDLGDTIEYEYEPLSDGEMDQLAEALANELRDEWGSVVQGVALLDQVFHYDHGLLDIKGDTGFGLQDGIWQHSGWEPMPDLQRRLAAMPELRELLSRLGRRASSTGSDRCKFRPRKRSASKDDMIGVEMDPLDPTSVAGLTYSGRLTSMLPSEAVLLRSQRRTLRWLFLAKKAESKLLSYELSGWTDVPTLPLPQTRRSVELPSAAGGPLVICLDTSHSMSGMRENLSKAVVLASVSAAHSQGRECRIVSFSSESNAVEISNATCDANGICRLLDFLSYSFGGGTDVTGALKYAMEVMENDLASSDLLLVSDGELPSVSSIVLAKLEGLKQQTGLEVHGLLVGKDESHVLDMLCNEVHTFLSRYDGIDGAASLAFARKRQSSASALSGFSSENRLRTLTPNGFQRLFRGRRDLSLHAVSPEHRADEWNPKLKRRSDRPKSKQRRRFDDDGEDWDFEGDGSYYQEEVEQRPSNQQPQTETSDYATRVETAMQSIQEAAEASVEAKKLGKEELSFAWSKSSVISDAISFVERGLVERDVEARLVVLGQVAREHVLFIGPPGTSKSEIGRRLAQLCGGPFFQRLFTRFTTPEEIFGPLSLRALENDEYVRCIDGFLPTATVAFLDEIFKANSASLNTLLTILNERSFDNGATRVNCPLKCVIGASNELPESEELDALLDRFLLRSYVTSVSDEGLVEILSARSSESDDTDPNISASLDEVVAEIASVLEDVTMDANICALIRDLRKFLREDLGVYVSDRRLVKAARLLKVSAASHGRTSVDYVDCLLLQHVVWQLPEQRDAIREWLWDHLTPGKSDGVAEQTAFLLQGLASESLELVKKTMGDITGEAGARAIDLKAIESIRKEVEEMEKLLITQFNALERHMKLLHDLPEHLWIGRDDAEAAKQRLEPLVIEASANVRQALTDTISLRLAISSNDIEDELRSSVVEMLTDQEESGASFTAEELQMSLKEAKRQYKGDLLRQWKAAKKEMN
ncbi:hypothetical protein ACHAXT_006721 [Thalassiosira profunda]